MAVGEAFPTGPEFLLAKSSFPSLKTPTVLSQQELGNPVGKAFANRVGVFANSLATHAFPVDNQPVFSQNKSAPAIRHQPNEQAGAARFSLFGSHEHVNKN
jgi:hypothetical protein